ncbi:hypothetical protein PUW24_07230 [Paenibacillus urinalis]|uniref:Uncharacterized protein n=1 Tax=Paenibacillus urinalis TaxID=521520 RepID=A0ABY7XCC3_9BACL|nr:hypothetical protein [Paenibacillus urinalis]WDH98703.1 hypothetical protein PUW24_07230 [Paenibacillus urinalis]WDI02396.1 hypothetical protein PUW25_24950 [Paenibacillus urinalis]
MKLDMQELINFIMQETGHSEELVEVILDCELDFLRSKGLVMDGPPENESEHPEPIIIDTDEMEAYIAEKLKVSKDIVGGVLGGEDAFMEAKGLVEYE